ncbi:MAG TPA: lysophospholipid acyltransferase family protein [Vicinamibacterales bacterium]|nr:lysophospholipid acyltransferase family protein [Vicinamibacterales bacterium]
MTEPAWRLSWTKRMQLAAIAGVGYPILAALGATYRFTVDGLEHLQTAQTLGQPIHAFWHGRILPGAIYFKRRGIVVITSENFDGEWIARIISKFGYGTARGSSSRGARKALLQMIRDVRERPVAFTLDGPRGPARVAQPGAVWLAKVTGNPIIPFHLESDRHWTLASWDRTQIPKPFATVALAFAPPIRIAPAAGAASLDQANAHLEEALTACEQRCRELLCR